MSKYQETLQTKDKAQISSMFDDISSKYDFLNHFLSLGIDKLWRRRAINILKKYKPKFILDIATGTGDFAIAALKLNPDKVLGIDISPKMIEVGKVKIKKKGITSIAFELGDSENILLEDNTVDAITVGFGVRNFEHLSKGLSEMHRVLKPEGIVLILEFSLPKAIVIKQFYLFYFNYILPFIGKMFSKHSFAYTYLPESVLSFPSNEKFIENMESVGFTETKQVKLSFGIASIYIGVKSKKQ